MKKIILLFILSIFSIFSIQNLNPQLIKAQTAENVIFIGRESNPVTPPQLRSVDFNLLDESSIDAWSFNWNETVSFPNVGFYVHSRSRIFIDSNDIIHVGINFDNTQYRVSRYDSDGNFINTINICSGGTQGVDFNLFVDNNGLIYLNDNTRVCVSDSNGNSVFTLNNASGGDIVTGFVIDDLGNFYVSANDRNIRKFSSTGSLMWTQNISGGTDQLPTSIELDNSGNVFVGTRGGWIYRLNQSNGSITNSNRIFLLSNNRVDNLKFIDNKLYASGGAFSIGRISKLNSNLSVDWSIANLPFRIEDLDVDLDGNIFTLDVDYNFRQFDFNGNETAFTPYISGGLQYQPNALAVNYVPSFTIEYPLEINLDSNYDPIADITYESNFLITTSSIINDILTTQSSITISSIKSDISPFTFLHWWDLDNNNVFTTNRTFTLQEPSRNYNLRAIYDLTNSIDLSLDSNLPSPPNFNVEVDTIENQRAIISQYPFINEEIPFGYNFIIEAPTDTVGVYVFDYWWDNINDQLFTTSAIVSLDAIENYNLTSVYSLPDEYQINLIIEVPIGFIIFQHGNLPPISGPFISTTIGLGDKWTATAPLTSDYRFLEWFDLENDNIFSFNRTININSTSRNYYLEGFYKELVTINFDTLGGTPINSFKVDINTFYNAPKETPIRPNFFFNGWALPSAPTTPIVFPQFGNQSITYQAIWLPTFDLTFNTNGGQVIPPQTIIENNLPTVVTPSRFGYTFDGWYTDNITFNNEFNFNTPFTSNTTIHAKWIFGTTANAETSLQSFLGEARLDNPIAQWILVLSLFILLNVMIFIYKGPFIVTIILNFILTALFIVFGFIPIWITIVLFMAIFGFMILMLSGGRS